MHRWIACVWLGEWEFARYNGPFGHCYRGVVSELIVGETETCFSMSVYGMPTIAVVLQSFWHQSVLVDSVLENGDVAQLVSEVPIGGSVILDGLVPILLVVHPGQMVNSTNFTNGHIILSAFE